MKLVVRVIEARNIPAMDQNGYSDPYVRLQLGRQRFKTKVVRKSLSPSWEEEFSFKVEDLKDELVISVLDEDKYFNDDFVGFLKIPVSRVFDADNKSLPTAWHSLQPKNKKSKNKDCGMFVTFFVFSFNIVCCFNFLPSAFCLLICLTTAGNCCDRILKFSKNPMCIS